jgi:hypothetical protein
MSAPSNLADPVLLDGLVAPHNLADPLLLDGLVVTIDVALLDVIVAVAHVLDLAQHNRSALADSLRRCTQEAGSAVLLCCFCQHEHARQLC